MGWIRCGLFAAGLLIVASCTTGTGSTPTETPSGESRRVIVTLAGSFRPEGDLGDQARRAQRTAIRAAQDAVLAEVPTAQVIRRYEAVPQLALVVDATALERLQHSPRVAAVQEDTAQQPS
ncbi:hypothetical protein ACFCV3_19640 [Kribbella sp. NPDC056345]|uniref:hypothetical protein n=1 Tax=Kribbella sp. NPDC056345 TaxID=3345789 RepID=UPI0035E087AF